MAKRQSDLDVRRTLVYPTTVRLEIQECPACGVVHGIPRFYADQMRAKAGTYHCPNGHSIGWSESDLDRERKKRERAEAAATRATARLDQAVAEADSLRNSLRSTKGHLTRMRNRIAAGVCPVPGCQRTGLVQTKRHIEAKHPEWAHEHPDVLA